MNKLFWLFFLILTSFFWVVQTTAVAPITVNNKFGIHLATPSYEDIKAASLLVNSQGGNWGYVTVVIPDNDLDVAKWQGIFDQLRRYQLIPIVRLATHGEGENWVVPQVKDSQKWLRFLNSLNWVVKNRYLLLFNEPNHATEWGGVVDPEEYAKVALEFAKTFKENNSDYFLMLAGLDQASPQQLPRYASADYFLRTVIGLIGLTNYEAYFDGLSSHSYPNPGFVAGPYGQGWGSVKGYEVELALLQDLGISKNLPVFITETGWRRDLLGEQTVADYFATAYNQIWLPDTRVIAVTPFLLNYQSEPFLGFSWQRENSPEFYSQYQTVKSLNKIKGMPVIEENINFNNRLPRQLVEDSSFLFKLSISNLGQGWWDSKANYELRLISPNQYYYRFGPLKQIEPGMSADIDFEFRTPKNLGQTKVRVGLYRDEVKVLESSWWGIEIMPLQQLTVFYRLLDWQNSGSDFKLLLYDQYENLVFESGLLTGTKGKLVVDKIRNVALGEPYRVVLLKPGFLPRQNYVTFQSKNNSVKMKLMWSLDWNHDGRWSLDDFTSLFSLKSVLR